jgi:hypothetical protein
MYMDSNNLFQKNSTSKNLSFFKKMGLLLLVVTIVAYLILSIKFLIS